MQKTILITGSNGLLGQKLVHHILNNTSYKLIATSYGKNRIESRNDFIYESLDITSLKSITNVFSKHLPDIVINTAAMTNVDACEDDKQGCDLLNITAVENLISVSKLHNSHLIHLSTDFVFDGEDGPYSENDKPNPLSYYGLSKFKAEELIKNSKLNKWSIARTIIVYGIVENMSRSNVVLWAKEALENKQKINVVDDQFRSPTFADDLAKGCIQIAETGSCGIYHLSGKDIMSILELVQRVADFYNLDKSLIKAIKSHTLNQKAKRPPKTGFILDKSRKDFSYKPRSFEDGLKNLEKELRLKN